MRAPICPVCTRPIRPGQPFEVVEGDPMHAQPCVAEYVEAVFGPRASDARVDGAAFGAGGVFDGGEDAAEAARYPERYGVAGEPGDRAAFRAFHASHREAA